MTTDDSTPTNTRISTTAKGGKDGASKVHLESDAISLVSRGAMGGLIGGGGYDFQERYITCRIVEWIGNPAFKQILHEGLGDADVLYGDLETTWREHIQIKDHEVDKSELRHVIDKFQQIDSDQPNLYRQYTLACLNLDTQLRKLNRMLDRLHRAGSFYQDQSGDTTGVIDVTELAIRKYIEEDLNLAGYSDFILNRLNIHTDLHNYHDDSAACITFIGSLLQQKEYVERFYRVAKPTYGELLREVKSRRGKTFSKEEIVSTLDSALSLFLAVSQAEIQELSLRKQFVLTIHNWASGKFDVEPDHTLDWCEYFDRPTRRVPTPEQWEKDLLPQVKMIEQAILAEHGAGVLRFRGFCCLTTGIAIGNIFREVSGWVTELHQSQTNALWRSDTEPAQEYTVTATEKVLNPDGESVAVLLNVKGDGIQDVLEYLDQNDDSVKVLVTIEPPSAAGSVSIKNDSEAVAFAIQTRDILQRVRKQHRTRTVHLFFYGPQALAVFIGQRLTSVGRIQLYEFQDPSYVPSCLLLT